MAKSINIGKKELINKANSNMVAAVAIAGFVIVFALIASRALWSQRGYQSRVISDKQLAVKNLNTNQQTVKKLAESYHVFISTPDNVIGGNPNGGGDKDGDNAKIVLDALPSKYDFPAFITSVEKLLKINNYSLKTIGGTDDEVAQKNSESKDPVEIPFQFTSDIGGYGNVKELLGTLEKSIRPIKIKKISLSGAGGSLIETDVEAVSYYQATKGITITKKVVK